MIEDKVKEITNISFKMNISKNEETKNKLNEDIKLLLTDLKKRAFEKFQSESDVKKFLDNISRFNNYSYNNQCLIWLQNPDATYIAPLRTFSKMGYHVNKGEKGLQILIPSFYKLVTIKKNDGTSVITYLSNLSDEQMKKYKDPNNEEITFLSEKLGSFRVGYVFDASQTNMPLDKIDEELYPRTDSDDSKRLTDTFIKAIYSDGYKVKMEEKIELGAKGYCDHKNKEIVLLKGLGSDIKLKVLIHEYAHALAHEHLLNNNREYQEHRNQYETEAESIAHVVSKYLGIDTNDSSASYLYAWSKEKDFKEIDDSFNLIVSASKKIINNFSKMFEKTKEYLLEELKPSI